MKDLQDFFESMGTKEFKHLSELMDKKSINPKNQTLIMGYIGKVYCAEKNVEDVEISEEEFDKLINDFSLSVSIYGNVTVGHMEIKKGRLMLTNPDNCSFSLTPAGIKSVERMISK